MEIKCLPATRSSCQEFVETTVEDRSETGAVHPVTGDVPLSILDLNDDCLELIFRHLNLKQLLNVTGAHPRFLTACRRTYSQNFKHNEITISAYQTTYVEYPRVLYLLGDVILCLRITYDQFNTHGHFNRRIHDAILQHCGDTLTEATFNHIQPTMQINQPFRQLRKLNFNQGCVGQILSEFNTWFPKLCSLEFFFCKTADTKCIEQTFPNLLHFTVAHHNFTFHNLRVFLDLNPQLRTFTIYNYDRELISQLHTHTKSKFQSLTTKFETYPCYFAFDSPLNGIQHLNN